MIGIHLAPAMAIPSVRLCYNRRLGYVHLRRLTGRRRVRNAG